MVLDDLARAIASNLAEELAGCQHEGEAQEVIQRAVRSLRAQGHARAVGMVAARLPQDFRHHTGEARNGETPRVEAIYSVVSEFCREGWKH